MSLIERIVLRPLGDDPPEARLLYGQDVRASLRLLPDESVQTVATSPPYWGLRDYGGDPLVWGGDPDHEHKWGAVGPDHHPGQVEQTKWKTAEAAGKGQTAGSGQNCLCGAWLGQLGLEPSPQLFVQHMVEVFREVHRVLRPDGTLWLNLGDSYNSGSAGGGSSFQATAKSWLQGSPRKRGPAKGLKVKDLCGMPWRVAFGLQDDGWWVRSEIIWAKTACMPESVRDRPTRSHETIFLLTKSKSYYYDADAIREPSGAWNSSKGFHAENQAVRQSVGAAQTGGTAPRPDEDRTGRNKRTVWNVNPKPYPGAHFAVWPEAIVEPMVKAGSSEHGCCSKCGSPWRRQTRRVGGASTKAAREVATQGNRARGLGGGTESKGFAAVINSPVQYGSAIEGSRGVHYETLGWEPTCDCDCDADTTPCTVLDPFSGSATTGAVSMRLGRNYVGIDLQSDYLDLAEARLTGRKAPNAEVDPEDDLIGDLFR